MKVHNLYEIFIKKLNDAGIRYAVTGSVASMLYGEPRFTNDIDIIIEILIKNIKIIANLFPPPEFYCPPEDILAIEAKRFDRGHFNIIHNESGFKADFYFIGKIEFYRWAIENAREYKLNDEIIYIAPPEYVITSKLEYYRESSHQKHLDDIRSMLEYSNEEIDFGLLNQFIEQHSLEKVWKEVEQS